MIERRRGTRKLRLRVLGLFLAIFGGVGMAALAVTLLMMFLGQRYMFYANPLHGDGDPLQIGMPDIRMISLTTVDGLKLSAWYKKAEPGCPTVIYFHGNEGDITGRAFKMEPLLHAGYGALFPEYRGYAGNPGRPTEHGLYNDARAAINSLKAEGIPPEQVVLMGESLGTGVAVKMALEFPPRALILEAPYTSLADVAQFQYPLLPVRLLVRDRFPSIARIGKVHAPVLILHGEKDESIPVEFARNLLAAALEPKQGVFFKDAGHSNLFAYGAVDAIADFVDPDGKCLLETGLEPGQEPRR